MLDISRSERYLILSLLVLGSILVAFSYFQKIALPGNFETIEIEERQTFININKANTEELERLPGIGPVLAQDIVAYREGVDGFKRPEELKNIKGIGDKKFEKIRDLIIISE